MAKSRQAKPKRINIFISYAREDSDLAACVEAELLQLFSLSGVDVFRDVNIPNGDNYDVTIQNALEDADILIVLLSDRMKAAYSYPGFEVGFFKRSCLVRPHIFKDKDIDRLIIPIGVGGQNPDMLHYIQSIQIDPSHVFKIADSDVNAGVNGDRENPVFSLLKRISDIAMVGEDLSDKQMEAIRSRLILSAARLHTSISAYLQGRVSSETYPERKIVIRFDKRPEVTRDSIDLSGSSVELLGKSFDVFGIPESSRKLTWGEFEQRMPPDAAGIWSESIRQLVSNALRGEDENYQAVTTTRGDRAYRLFVSRTITYVSQQTETHIYIVRMVVRQYGDPLTTRTLSAISIGLRFRFLLLEKDSKFNPDRLELPIEVDVSKEPVALKAVVVELLSEMDLILRDAKAAQLMDPDLLMLIWGHGAGPKVQEMMGTWEIARAALYAASQQVLAGTAGEIKEKRKAFIAALRDLCAATKEMNREYTLRAVRAVAAEIEDAGSVAARN